MGNSKVPMYLSMMMNAINVGGNAILIFGFDMGVAGAATSTLVSRVISAVAIILLLCSPEHLLHLERPFSFKLDFGMLKKIAYIGIPNGLENGMFQLGKNHGAEHDYRLLARRRLRRMPFPISLQPFRCFRECPSAWQ